MRVARAVLMAAFFLSACDQASTAPPAGPVSFAQQVQPIFANCTACHGAQPATRPMRLEPGQAYASIVNVPALGTDTSTRLDRVEPGNAETSYLLHKVLGTHTSPTVRGGGGRMPPGCPTTRACLTDADVQLIRRWISEGAANN